MIFFFNGKVITVTLSFDLVGLSLSKPSSVWIRGRKDSYVKKMGLFEWTKLYRALQHVCILLISGGPMSFLFTPYLTEYIGGHRV